MEEEGKIILIDSTIWCKWIILVGSLPVILFLGMVFLSPGFTYGIWWIVSPSWAVGILEQGRSTSKNLPISSESSKNNKGEQEMNMNTSTTLSLLENELRRLTESLSSEPWIRKGWGFHPSMLLFMALVLVMVHPTLEGKVL